MSVELRGGDAALQDVTNGISKVDMNGDEERTPRNKGWSEPQAYDYAAYKEGGESAIPNQIWGHDAAKYEWKEEFGDVGPAVEELEDQLYRNDHRPKQGTEMSS